MMMEQHNAARAQQLKMAAREMDVQRTMLGRAIKAVKEGGAEHTWLMCGDFFVQLPSPTAISLAETGTVRRTRHTNRGIVRQSFAVTWSVDAESLRQRARETRAEMRKLEQQ